MPESVHDLSREQLLALIDLLMARPCLTRKDLAMRYGKTLVTIDRYKADGTLPRPKYFHGPLWTPAQITAAEASPRLKQIRKKGDDKVRAVLQREFKLV